MTAGLSFVEQGMAERNTPVQKLVMAAIAAGLLVACGVAWLRRAEPPVTLPAAPAERSGQIAHTPVPESAFAGQDTCGNCHAEIWEKYRQHPMARSLAPPLAAVPQLETYTETEFVPPGPRRYSVERLDGTVLHHESLKDEAGQTIYDQAEPVSYALGSGKRGRSYFFEEDGGLFKSSISWFSDHAAWGLSPDYPPAAHKRFDRRITEGCVNCHAGRVAIDRSAPDRFGAPAILEAPIGCERCHGAGARHVAAHEAADVRQVADEAIVNPAHLDADRQIAICAQCHLHGEARVIRTGLRSCDFQPGQLLEDNRIVFVSQAGRGTNSRRQALSQVEQMAQSACFRGSAGRLTCTSCHDPHALPRPEERVEFYRSRCLTCHESRGCALPADVRRGREPADSCMACHMPASLELSNILHVSFADHRVLREPARSLPAEDESTSGDDLGVMIFDQADERLPAVEVDRAWAFALVGGTEQTRPTPEGARRAEQLLLPVVRQQPDDVDALEVLGTACFMQQRSADAEKYWTKVLERDPRRETTLRHLGTMKYAQRQMPAARDYLKRYLEVNPRYGSMHARYAGALGALGDWPGCIAAGERALERNPTQAAVHELLAYAYQQIGNQAESERHQKLHADLQRLIPQAAIDE